MTRIISQENVVHFMVRGLFSLWPMNCHKLLRAKWTGLSCEACDMVELSLPQCASDTKLTGDLWLTPVIYDKQGKCAHHSHSPFPWAEMHRFRAYPATIFFYSSEEWKYIKLAKPPPNHLRKILKSPEFWLLKVTSRQLGRYPSHTRQARETCQ